VERSDHGEQNSRTRTSAKKKESQKKKAAAAKGETIRNHGEHHGTEGPTGNSHQSENIHRRAVSSRPGTEGSYRKRRIVSLSKKEGGGRYQFLGADGGERRYL